MNETSLAYLVGRVITLAISTDTFHGKIAGRVRRVEGDLSGRVNLWVGDFCFDADAVVSPERYEDGPHAWQYWAKGGDE